MLISGYLRKTYLKWNCFLHIVEYLLESSFDSNGDYNDEQIQEVPNYSSDETYVLWKMVVKSLSVLVWEDKPYFKNNGADYGGLCGCRIPSVVK